MFKLKGAQATKGTLNLNVILAPFSMVTNLCRWNFTFHEIILVGKKQHINHPVISHDTICCQHFYGFTRERSVPVDKVRHLILLLWLTGSNTQWF